MTTAYLIVIFALFSIFIFIGIRAQNDRQTPVYWFLAGLFLGMDLVGMALGMVGKI